MEWGRIQPYFACQGNIANGVKVKPGAAGVKVAKVVGENLQLISAEVAVVPQHVVVAGS